MEINVRQKHTFNDDQIEAIAANVKEVFLDSVMDYMKVYNINLIDKEDLDNLFEIVLDAIDFNED